ARAARRPRASRCGQPLPSALATRSLHDALPICGDLVEDGEAVAQRVVDEVATVGVQHVEEERCQPQLPGQLRLGPGTASPRGLADRKSTRLNSSHVKSSYAVYCVTKKTRRPWPE